MRQDIVLLDIDSQTHTHLKVENEKALLLAKTVKNLANLASNGMWDSYAVKQYPSV